MRINLQNELIYKKNKTTDRNVKFASNEKLFKKLYDLG